MNALQTVQELPPAHSLVLNKFNTMRNHALIITKEFKSQEEALTVAGAVAKTGGRYSLVAATVYPFPIGLRNCRLHSHP